MQERPLLVVAVDHAFVLRGGNHLCRRFRLPGGLTTLQLGLATDSIGNLLNLAAALEKGSRLLLDRALDIGRKGVIYR